MQCNNRPNAACPPRACLACCTIQHKPQRKLMGIVPCPAHTQGTICLRIDNHDTQRGAAPLTFQRDGVAYVLATVFMLASPYGYPKVGLDMDIIYTFYRN
eukprot:1176383-Prorocentrum_minimum.AAC.1